MFSQFSTIASLPISSTSLPWKRSRSESLSSLNAWRDVRRLPRRIHSIVMMSGSDSTVYKMNLNEYMVTLEKPLGIRFALSLDGRIFVHSLRKGGNAERSKIVMVGDTLKKASDVPGGGFNDINDLSDAEKMLVSVGASQSLVLERPFSPFPVQQLNLNSDWHILFNRGKVPFTTWNGTLLASNLQSSSRQSNSGFVIFSPKFLSRQGWMLLVSQDKNTIFDYKGTTDTKDIGEIVGICSEENNGSIEWGYGSFPLEEYVKALERSKGELYYNHSLGMQYSKITEQIYVGSCIQSESDVQKLSNMVYGANCPTPLTTNKVVVFELSVEEAQSLKMLSRKMFNMKHFHRFGKIYKHVYNKCHISGSESGAPQPHGGITAVLNFQSESERANWGINSGAINESCCNSNILMVNYPIREVDSVDLRKKLPFSAGLLLRLLRKNHRIFVTCTTGFDRSPACVIAYLHWIQDTGLSAAHNFVTGLHSCRPDRPAIVWATWDLIAMAENGKFDGPPTHAVNIVWNNGCREGEEVCLVGDFTGNWKESIKAVHKGGSRYEAEVRLRHGKHVSYFRIYSLSWS